MSPSERRIIAVPTTEDPASPLNRRTKMADDYFEKAMKVVDKTMSASDPKLRWDAAKWVAEMVMGKPKQAIESEGGTEAEMARLLGLAYAEHLKTQAALPPSIEDGVYILGEVVEGEVTEIVDTTSPPPKSKRTWDALPE